jgi:hypothetical protein
MPPKSYLTKKNYEHKTKPNGTPNPKYVDLLEVDKPIAGQAFGCFSFISPETIIKQRNEFYFEEFLKSWEMNKSMEKFHQFLNFVSYKYKLNFQEVIKDFESFIDEEKDNIVSQGISDDYKNYLDRNEDELEKKFNVKHNFQTSVRGFKARGNFATEEEARMRCELLRETDPNFDIFVGPVGTWLPWDPEPLKTADINYAEEELNQLVTEKKKNETAAKAAFDQRVKETKQKAVEDNKKNAEKFGSKVTQDIDNEGNLVGVGETSTEKTFSKEDAENVTTADIRKELFESENVVTGKSDYGQSQLKSGPFAPKTD